MSHEYRFPWCSSVHVRDRPRKVYHRELKSAHHPRENIWEYLHNEKKKKYSNSAKKLKIIFSMLVIGGVLYCYREQISIGNLEMMLTQIEFLSLSQQRVSTNEECCYRMQHLTLKSIRLENVLRTTLRMRRTLLTQSFETENKARKYIVGAQAVKGSGTKEWGGRVALWGVIPLWRAAPPPDTILALRKPTPSDCWPFSGSTGEVIIEVPQSTQVHSISVEHIRPDTAQSAPKDFIVYGILENGTWIKAADGTYRFNKPAKQYYSLDNSAPLKRIVFRVLSNHGNSKYTCVYRVHLYCDSIK